MGEQNLGVSHDHSDEDLHTRVMTAQVQEGLLWLDNNST